MGYVSEDLYRRWGRNIRRVREIKDARDERRSSGIEAMAKALAVTPETVSRWETGKLVPRDAKKIEIAEYLDCPAEMLFPLVREVSS